MDLKNVLEFMNRRRRVSLKVSSIGSSLECLKNVRRFVVEESQVVVTLADCEVFVLFNENRDPLQAFSDDSVGTFISLILRCRVSVTCWTT
jgi:hypothetical protein